MPGRFSKPKTGLFAVRVLTSVALLVYSSVHLPRASRVSRKAPHLTQTSTLQIKLQVNHRNRIPHLPSIPIHHRRIHHKPPIISPWTQHRIFPHDAGDAIPHDGHGVHPRTARKHVVDEAVARPCHDRLVGSLALVKVDGLAPVAPVDMAKDVEFGLDAPDLFEEAGAAEVQVAVEALLIVRFGAARLLLLVLPVACE